MIALDSELLTAIVPYQWVLSLFVLTPPPIFTFPKQPQCNWWWRLLYILYCMFMLLLTSWVTYLNNVLIEVVVSEFDLDSITSVLSISANVAVSLVQCVLQVATVFGSRQLSQIYADIAELEQDIRWRCVPRNLSPPSKRFSFRWRLASRSGALLLFVLVVMPFVNYPLIADRMPPLDKSLTTFFSLLIQLKCVEFCVTVQMVHELLAELLQHLRHLRHDVATCGQPERARRRVYVSNSLRANQNLLARIWLLVNAIERYFSFPLLMLFLYNGLAIIHTMNWAYIQVKDALNIFRLSFTVVVIINMLIPCWLSQSCIDAYKQFGAVLHSLKSNGSDVTLSMHLTEYSLQLMHQKVIFTCGGFFDINLKYFGAMLLTITTYVVILIQFKLQGDAEKENHSQQLNATRYHHT